jgi:pimeloyl-ACP methyl ester carboxylesterase
VLVDGCDLHVDDTGGDGHPVVFSHGLLLSGDMFRAQVDALRGRYRCVSYDHRGQGRSAVPAGRAITIEQCYEDAVALIERLRLAPCHFVGLSMGGFVGMRLAARRPDLVRSLVLLDTSADPEPAENVPRYRRLNLVARWLGVGLVAGRVMPILFGRSFLADPARAAERREWRARLAGNRRAIHKAVTGVIERPGVYDELSRVRAPTLVAVGEEDVATVPARAERLHAAIAGSVLARIPRAGHSSTIENPGEVNRLLAEFLGR